MTAYTINTLEAARKLQGAGMDTKQAEAVAEVMASQSGELATKGDLEAVEKSLKSDVVWLRWICGIILAFVLALTWQVFTIGRDVSALVATLTAGG